MVKKVLAFLLIISGVCAYAQTRPGSLRGTVTDVKTGETLPAVNVVVKDAAGNKITGGSTDFDGQYNINPINPGTYNVEVTSMGYATINLNGVIISPNTPTIQDFKMQEQTTELTEVEIVYERPLIDKTKTATVIDAEDIVNMAVRDITSVAAQAAGVTQSANGETNIRGARGEGTVYFIDGVKVRGSVSIPQAAIQQTEVITGGLPAQYGDAVGGVINTTTRGPSPEYFGSVELLTSTPLELISTNAFGDYDYNLAAFTLGGPIYKNDAGVPIVGFLLSSEFFYVKEGSPTYIPYIKLDDDVLTDIEANPIDIDPSGQSIIYRSEFVTNDDLSDIPYQQNSYSNEIRLNGNVQIKTSRTTNLTIGGRLTYSNDKSSSYANHIFNYENNLDQISSDWSTYVRFQQQFGESDENSLIKNAFYNIQVDYTRNKDEIFDRRYRDDYFKYGHVGYYDVKEQPAYVYGEDTINGGVVEGWRYVGNAPIGVDFTPGEYNEVRGNYVSRYYELAEENPGLSTLSINALKGAGIPVNGTNPRAVYGGLWGSPGTGQSFAALGVSGPNYYKSRNSQFRVTASTNFDIKDHSLIVGIEYEQRSDRAFALNATALWQRMELFQNSAIQQIDLDNPIMVTDENGVYQDTINYPRLFSPDDVSQIDRNIRIALGRDPQSTDLINIHNLDPDLFSLDMFSPDELINPGGPRYVGYYGYDYTGNILDQQPSISDFFTERDENGLYTRPVGAFQPIYIAGYIQDQFTFNDLTFNVGVRVDRFDLNQQVLKDPYVLYPTYSVRDLASSGLPSEAISEVPSSVGGDYVVYVSSFDYGTASIVGYRDPESNQWFNEAGEPISDPVQLAEAAGGNIKPLLVSPPSQDGDTSNTGMITGASFKDYDPQTVVMPRIAFNFPITDEALFIAHYDVLAQRPTTGIARLDPFNYMDLDRKRATGPLNNPDLKPQKTTEYELGFKQALTDRSALKISAFYRELRDLIQTLSFTQAYPLQYVAYGNLDYGTVKGFSLEYELRRTNNIKLDANYTLQFADGTGSGPNTGLNLASNNQPNLRYILPLDYDNRHQVMVRFDYRYDQGSRYNGPVWWNSRVFENAGINITMNGLSGTPYTRRDAAYPLTTGNPSSISQVAGQINGSRLPWTVTFDARINKIFNISGDKRGQSLEVYLQILNLFNTQNIVNVYPFTGSPDDDGYLASSSAQSQIQQQVNAQAYVDLYNRRMMSPYNYGLPRRVRLGIAYNF